MSMYIPSVDEAAKKIVKYYNDGAIDELNAVGEYLENNDVAKSIAEYPSICKSNIFYLHYTVFYLQGQG